jgi:hypothetical protein
MLTSAIDLQVWARPLASNASSGARVAVVLFNPNNDGPNVTVNATLAQLGLRDDTLAEVHRHMSRLHALAPPMLLRLHTHTHTHARARTHTHTHTHTPSPYLQVRDVWAHKDLGDAILVQANLAPHSSSMFVLHQK